MTEQPARADLGTPERHQHTDSEGNPVLRSEETPQAGIRRARVTDNITRMRANGQLGDREYVAAVKLRDWYAVYCLSMPSPAYDGVPAPDSYGSRTPGQRSLDAGMKYRTVMNRVPAAFHGILDAVVCHDMTLTHYAAGKGKPRQWARGYFDGALSALVDAMSKA